MVSIDQIKQLREETDISISECKRALTEANGDFAKAKEILRKMGMNLAAKRAERVAGQGIIDSYVHPNKKVGVLLDLRCESDFVARSEGFQKLAHELCLQVAAMEPEADNFLSQPWIKDSSKTMKDLLNETIAKMGENIVISKFQRFEL